MAPQQPQQNPALTPPEAAAALNKISGDNQLGLNFGVVQLQNGSVVVEAKLGKDLSKKLDNSYANGGPALSEILPPGFIIVDEQKAPSFLDKARAQAAARTGINIGAGGRAGTGGGVGGAAGGAGAGVGVAGGENVRLTAADVGGVAPKPGSEHVIRALPRNLNDQTMGHFAAAAPVLKMEEDGNYKGAMDAIRQSAPPPGAAGPAPAGGDISQNLTKALPLSKLAFQNQGGLEVAPITEEQATNLKKALAGLTDDEKKKIGIDEKSIGSATRGGVTTYELDVSDSGKFIKYGGAIDMALFSGDPTLTKKAIATAESKASIEHGNEPVVASVQHGLPQAAKDAVQQARG